MLIELRLDQHLDIMPIAPLFLGRRPLPHPLIFDKQLEVIEIRNLPHVVK